VPRGLFSEELHVGGIVPGDRAIPADGSLPVNRYDADDGHEIIAFES
jgi:hypothetical protein